MYIFAVGKFTSLLTYILGFCIDVDANIKSQSNVPAPIVATCNPLWACIEPLTVKALARRQQRFYFPVIWTGILQATTNQRISKKKYLSTNNLNWCFANNC